jgi:hypothetical protein
VVDHIDKSGQLMPADGHATIAAPAAAAARLVDADRFDLVEPR